MNPPRLRPVGERAVLLEGGVATAAALRRLAAQRGIALVDVVPGEATVLVTVAEPGELARLVAALPDLDPGGCDAAGEADTVEVEVAVRYDGEDLADVAAATGMSVAEVVRRHSHGTYQAAFTGFAPGFAYLSGLDVALHLPRRATPRTAVPTGSLAVADGYTAVYPRSSPGGWNLLGRTTMKMFDPARRPAALLAPGTIVHFVVEPGPRR